jgi:hypothetical protein
MKATGTVLLHKANISGTRHGYDPTCGFPTSPEVGPVAFASTLNTGYPVLLCQGDTPVATIEDFAGN